MALGNVFKKASSIAIKQFAEELGGCTFHKRLSTSSYDAESGEVTHDYDDYSDINIAFVGLDDKEVPDLANRSEHKKALISGNDLLVEPRKGDMITDHNQKKLYVSRVRSDMYKAQYIAYVKEVNEG